MTGLAIVVIKWVTFILSFTGGIMIGKVINRKYRILEQIGAGTVAMVYLARNLATNDMVALKVMHAELIEEGQFLRCFRREAKLLEEMDSPYAVQLLDYGENVTSCV
jgi:serine/threonine-protein kinase